MAKRNRAAARPRKTARRFAELSCFTEVIPSEYGDTLLHDERLDSVVSRLLADGARSVLDLGCGRGALLERLVQEEQFTRIVGVDVSAEALLKAERLIAPYRDANDGRVSLDHGSFEVPERRWAGFDAAAMVETIEHIEPERLSLVERSVFVELRPAMVVMTTPNCEYNPLFGLAEGEVRHSDHRFEWNRAKFRSWAAGVARRNRYAVNFHDVGPSDPLLGSPTQMGVFRLAAGPPTLSDV